MNPNQEYFSGSGIIIGCISYKSEAPFDFLENPTSSSNPQQQIIPIRRPYSAPWINSLNYGIAFDIPGEFHLL